MSGTPPRSDVTGIVLAGGRSTRFGGDKLAVEIGGTAIVDLAIEAVAVVAAEVVIAGEPSGPLPQIPDTSIRVVADSEPFGGPLVALAGALAETSTNVALVVAGDMPSLIAAVLALLLETLDSSPAVDAVVLADPTDPTQRQPLPLAIRVDEARAATAAALKVGDRSLVRLLGRLVISELPFDWWGSIDPGARTLADIDVPDDLRRLRADAPDQRMR